MTIRTIPQASSISLENRSSDMQKRTVRKNLFGTTVDRAELQQQIGELESESNRTLEKFKIDSVIGFIDKASDDQPRSMKRPLNCIDSDTDDTDDESQGIDLSRQISADNDSDDDSQPNAKIDEAASASTQPTSSKKSEVKLVQQLKTKGQKTIKGEIITSRRY